MYKEKSVAISSLDIRESPSNFEREEIGPRLSNDKRVALSSLRRRGWPYVKEEESGPILCIEMEMALS